MNEEIESLDGFLDGDDFVNEQTKEEEAARQRRLKRKRRLEKIQIESRNSLEISTKAAKVDKRESGTNSFSLPPQVDNDALRNPNPDARKIDADADPGEFDMFSSSVSPPSRGPGTLRNQDNNTVNGKVNNQQDWDDAEGYYKATLGQWEYLLRLRKCSMRVLNCATKARQSLLI